MHRIPLIATILMLFFLPYLSVIAKPIRNVLDHYKAMPKPALGDKFQLRKSSDGWQGRSSMDYWFDITVDFRNGYLMVSDPGTGGGRYNQTVALFLGEENRQYVLIEEFRGDSVCSENALSAYRYDPKTLQYVEVTEEILPTPTFGLFYSSKESAAIEIPKPNECGPAIYFILPHEGTTVEYRLYQEPDLDAPELPKRSLFFTWDAKNETFRFDRKAIGPE